MTVLNTFRGMVANSGVGGENRKRGFENKECMLRRGAEKLSGSWGRRRVKICCFREETTGRVFVGWRECCRGGGN